MRNEQVIGGWRVDFAAGWIRKRGLFRKRQFVDARLLGVLEFLCNNAGRTVTTEELLDGAWPGRVVGRDSVTTAIYQLRLLLGDSAEQPGYIRSDARRGYRLIAPVRALTMPRMRIGASFVVAVTVAIGAIVAAGIAPEKPRFLVIEPLQDLSQLTEMRPLFEAIDTTLFSEIVARSPASVLSDRGARDDVYRMQSRLVACDLGPALVVRLEDTRSEVYFWARAYNLDETFADLDGPSLVTQVASEVAEALRAYNEK